MAQSHLSRLDTSAMGLSLREPVRNPSDECFFGFLATKLESLRTSLAPPLFSAILNLQSEKTTGSKEGKRK